MHNPKVYHAGNTVRLRGVFRDYDGKLVDPTIVKVILYDYRYNLINQYSAIRIGLGIYIFDYTTPNKDERYIYEWYGEIDGTPSLRRGSFMVKFID